MSALRRTLATLSSLAALAAGAAPAAAQAAEPAQPPAHQGENATPAAAAPAAAGGDLGALLARHSQAIVRVEAVLATRLNFGGQGEETESRLDLLGAVVSPGGLLMVWNSHVSSTRISELMQSSGRGGGDMAVQVVPRAFTVMLPEGEVPAFLAATDSALDLAFLQLERPPAAPLPWIDFAASVRPAVGEEVAAVSRLGRGFDHAPLVQTARVAGVLRKPREAWILDGTLTTFGLPVFDRRGAPVGALTTVVARGTAAESAAGAPTVGQVLGGAFGLPGEGPLGVFVLPGERVASLVKLAEERARQLLAERVATSDP